MGKISIIDVGAGNIRSIYKAVGSAGADPVVVSEPGQVAAADKLILPGVGHFDAAMSRLRDLGFVDALDHAVFARGRPVLGICLGMQLMATHSEEGTCAGLGWLESASVVRFRLGDAARCKVPHIGWNPVASAVAGRLFRGVAPDSECYFSHTFHLAGLSPGEVIATTSYGYEFPAAVERGNLFGVQFHPEKSRAAGIRILQNFASL